MDASTHRRASTLRSITLALAALVGASLSTTRGLEAQSVTPKSPSTARTIAFFVPGGGHIYAGEPIKGAFLLAASAGAAAAGVVASEVYSWDYTCERSDCMDPNGGPKYGRLYLGLGVAGALWLYSVFDAPRAARRANERGSFGPVSLSPTASLSPGGVRPGLALHIGF